MRIGVLALQGGFAEHVASLNRLGAAGAEIRKPSDLEGGIDGLILPGGESTVISRLLHETGLYEPIGAMIKAGTPVFGTCAGMILLADKITNEPYAYFGCIDIAVKRNAFGRQLGSFRTTGEFSGIGEVPMTFIRAPYIESAGPKARVLARVGEHIVAAEQGGVLATAFHPELTEDLRVHEYFLRKIK